MNALGLKEQFQSEVDAARERYYNALDALPEWNIEAQLWGGLMGLVDHGNGPVIVPGVDAEDALTFFDVNPSDYEMLRAVPVAD